MLAHYGVDVLDPTVSFRRIDVLLRRLPPGAWTDAQSPASWSHEAHLLAQISDILVDLTWVTARAAGSKMQRPKPMPRPWKMPASTSASTNGRKTTWHELMQPGAIDGG